MSNLYPNIRVLELSIHRSADGDCCGTVAWDDGEKTYSMDFAANADVFYVASRALNMAKEWTDGNTNASQIPTGLVFGTMSPGKGDLDNN